MRLTSVVLHSDYDSEDVEFSLRENDVKNRYIVRSMVGIDADELVPKFNGVGIETGSKFYETVMKPRNIVMRVALNPFYHINENASDLRDELYRIISSNRSGQLQAQFKSGAATVCGITGMITKFEVGHFTRLPEVQITLNCPDPMFRSLNPVDFDIADLPTANPLIISDISSTAPHGFSFKVELTAPFASFKIQNHPTTPDWEFEIEPLGGFVSGDELHFSSEFGQKTIYHQKTVGSGPIMDKVTPNSIWPFIFPGHNRFHFSAMNVMDWLELSYHSSYWGL